MDCGPSCLAMIAKHYGIQPNIDVIRKKCSLGKAGVSLLGISKTAEELGFKTIGGRLSSNTLVTEAPLPCIAHWNQNHFVVVYKIKKKPQGSIHGLCRRPWKRIDTIQQGRILWALD